MSRLRYIYLPWWRVALGVAAVMWAIGFGVLYFQSTSVGAHNEWIGLISVIPIWAFATHSIVRERRWNRDFAKQSTR